MSGKIALSAEQTMAARSAVRGGWRQDGPAAGGFSAKNALPISAPTIPCVMVSMNGERGDYIPLAAQNRRETPRAGLRKCVRTDTE